MKPIASIKSGRARGLRSLPKRPGMPPEGAYALANAARVATNLAHSMQPMPEFLCINLGGAYPDLAPERSFLQQQFLPPVTSIGELEERFRRIAADDRVSGLVLKLSPLALSMAQLESLRQAIADLRAAGKRVVAWSTGYSTASYFLATAADEILLQPGGAVLPLGLQQGYSYLADSLGRLGLRFDMLQISPYKTAADSLTRSEMSEAAREMANWLVEDAYGTLLAAIAKSRGIDAEAAAALVDASPYIDGLALELGLVDGLVGEADLPKHLAGPDEGLSIGEWDKHGQHVFMLRPDRAGQRVALIRIEGMIVDGQSEQPPLNQPLPLPMLGGPRAGDRTLVAQARQALEDKDVAAVVLYIDSPGGSATASEAMAGALAELAAAKPLVAVMGSVAASGGYYVAAPAAWVIARPGTITGSIGVLSGKLVDAGLLDRLRIGRDRVKRGENADFDSGEALYSAEQRARAWQMIERTYALFLDRVESGRKMDRRVLEDAASGKVWTGKQAQERGLVDAMGGLEDGLIKARELAGLHRRAPLVALRPQKRQRFPLAFGAAAGLGYSLEGLRQLEQAGTLCLCPLLGVDRAFGG